MRLLGCVSKKTTQAARGGVVLYTIQTFLAMLVHFKYRAGKPGHSAESTKYAHSRTFGSLESVPTQIPTAHLNAYTRFEEGPCTHAKEIH